MIHVDTISSEMVFLVSEVMMMTVLPDKELTLWYKGKQYPATIAYNLGQENHVDFNLQQQCFHITLHESSDLSATLKRFYTRETRKLVEACVNRYRTHFPTVAAIYIKDSMKFWGQCNGKRELTFHWQLSMIALDAMEYVVIHELCHLLHLNHDRSFWRLVGKYCANYESMQTILAQYQMLIRA